MERCLTFFLEGAQERLLNISKILDQYEYRNWVIPADSPAIPIQRIKRVKTTEEGIRFHCRDEHIDIKRGDGVLAILAIMMLIS